MKEFQEKIEKEIQNLSRELSVPPAELYEPARYILSLGGKRIRPLLTLLSCDLFGGKAPDVIDAAMAVELFHNFTLMHDDIMDHAPLRRNQPTVHEKWNVSTAILSGDMLLVKAFQKIHECGHDLIEPVFSQAAVMVCEGQQLDLNYSQAEKISIPQYFKMIELKTAALIAASMKIGAFAAGCGPSDAENIYECGKNTGIAFQLMDDLLDVYGETEKFGKQQGGDILSGKKTFLLLKAIELCGLNAYKKDELLQWLAFKPSGAKEEKEKVEAVKSIYDFCNVKKVTEEEIRSYHKKSASFLERTSADESKKKNFSEFIAGLLFRQS